MPTAIAHPTEHLNIVIVGHVDHGKSTLLGRLYADTDSLPEGKLDKVRDICRRQGKEFEYAFLFDAFLEEQEQGITIDTARTFFAWEGRHYIIIDAPGHKEFLKNMVSGAARAEAALLVIDAHEGVREQSKKHGYLLSLLGIRQVAVIVNKMDLVGYRQDVFGAIEKEYRAFLAQLKVVPERFVPVSAKLGDNIAKPSAHMPWYSGPTVLETLGLFRKETARERQTLRFPVQDVYKFDARRIITGRLAAGRIKVGDRLIFSPSNKTATVKTIEAFNVEPVPTEATAGQSTGITLDEQIFIQRGEIASHEDSVPLVSTTFRCNLFWMGRRPLEARRRDIAWVKGDVGAEDRARNFGHRAALVLITGARHAGKSMLARRLEVQLVADGRHTYLLDAANLRRGLDADLSEEDTGEIVRRFGEVARLLMDTGLIVVSTTNAFDGADHQAIRTLVHPTPVITVHMSKGEEAPPPDTDLAFAGPKDFEAIADQVMEELKRRGVLAQAIGAKPQFHYSI